MVSTARIQVRTWFPRIASENAWAKRPRNVTRTLVPTVDCMGRS